MRTFPVSAGLLEHKSRMGAAIWEFLWLVDQVTSDEPGENGKFLGIVKYGQAISAERVASDLDESVDTAKVNLKKLCAEGYVQRKRVVAVGYSYVVCNSLKWIWARENGHRVKNPSIHRVENPSMKGKKPADDRVENPSNNKESKILGRVGRQNQNHHARGALTDWLRIKAKLQTLLSAEESNLWLRPLYLLKVLSGGTLLLALPPNGRIIEAARANGELLLREILSAGYGGFALTRYPDEYERERLRQEAPEFYEQMLGTRATAKHAAELTRSKNPSRMGPVSCSANVGGSEREMASGIK